jgi:hypothetical protein
MVSETPTILGFLLAMFLAMYLLGEYQPAYKIKSLGVNFGYIRHRIYLVI